MLIQAEAIDAVLQCYGLGRLGEPEAVADSVVNVNFSVETTAGPRFVRVHREGQSIDAVRAEHGLIDYAGAAGVPVNRALADDRGATVHEAGGRLISVFPWLDGHTVGRDTTLTTGDVELLGEMEGRIHAALVGYDGPQSKIVTGTAWKTPNSIAVLERVLAALDERPSDRDAFPGVRTQVRRQIELLESGAARPHSEFDGIARQTVHGDYHNRNVMFDDAGQVQAVVDWELAHPLPPVFELLRAITFTLGEGRDVDDVLVEAWLRGYARHAHIAFEECELGVEMWSQHLLQGTWVYATRFLAQDTRVDPFVSSIGPNIERFADEGYRAKLAGALKRTVGE